MEDHPKPPGDPEGTPSGGRDPNAGFEALGALIDELREESRESGRAAVHQIRRLESTRQFAEQI